MGDKKPKRGDTVKGTLVVDSIEGSVVHIANDPMRPIPLENLIPNPNNPNDWLIDVTK
jgi:hypothetical protein